MAGGLKASEFLRVSAVAGIHQRRTVGRGLQAVGDEVVVVGKPLEPQLGLEVYALGSRWLLLRAGDDGSRAAASAGLGPWQAGGPATERRVRRPMKMRIIKSRDPVNSVVVFVEEVGALQLANMRLPMEC